MQTIDNLNITDKELLISILDSVSYSGELKSVALDKLKSIDKKEASKYVKSILSDIKKYTDAERKSAIYTASYLIRSDKVNNSDNKKALLEFAENQFAKSTDNNLNMTLVFALGEAKDRDAIKLMLKYRKQINDDKLLAFIADINFTVINEMLGFNNDESTINAALDFCKIAPFSDYTIALSKLMNYPQLEIRAKALDLYDIIKSKSVQRNKKWDDYK